MFTIIVGGINVYPREIEDVLAMHDLVGVHAAPDDLDCDALSRAIDIARREMHLAHAAAAYQFAQLVVPESCRLHPALLGRFSFV